MTAIPGKAPVTAPAASDSASSSSNEEVFCEYEGRHYPVGYKLCFETTGNKKRTYYQCTREGRWHNTRQPCSGPVDEG